MIRIPSFFKLSSSFPQGEVFTQAVSAACVGNRVFCSTKSAGDSTSSILSKRIENKTSQILLEIKTKERLPFAVWQKVHSTLIPSDFSWNPKERRWEAAITPMSKDASNQVLSYTEEVKDSIAQLHREEKEQMDKKWVKDEDAYIEKWYPEQHKKVQSKIAGDATPKVESSKLIGQIMQEALDLIPSGLEKNRFCASLRESLEGIDCLDQFDPKSVRKAALTSAVLGLSSNSYLQQCYFIPFEESLHFVIGYRGLIELSLRSGEVSFYEAKCVYEKDSFEIKEGEDPKIWHRPFDDIKNRGKITTIYAIRVMKNGQKDIVALSADDIKNMKNKKDVKNTPWGLWHEEMCTKTLIKILAKQSELSTETRR